MADAKIPQIEEALKEEENKHLKSLKPPTVGESEDEIDYLDPLYLETQAVVS